MNPVQAERRDSEVIVYRGGAGGLVAGGPEAAGEESAVPFSVSIGGGGGGWAE